MIWLAVLLVVLMAASALYARNPAQGLSVDHSRLPEHSDLDDLVEKLVAELTLDEKLEQLSGDSSRRRFEWRYFRSVVVYKRAAPITYAGQNERLGLPPVAFSDGPRGVSTIDGGTCFPATMLRGATWDVDLERRVGEAMGRETRAAGANLSGAVCINLLRHPGWGRAQETYGEDPHLLGQLGLALTRGLQGEGVMACVKHFACNSLENSRFRVDVRIDERALHEVYLPHFRTVCAEAACVMSAYNKLRGEHCGHSRELLTEILRKRWGYRGLVISDWLWGVRDGVAAVRAGLGIEMPGRWRYGRPLAEAVRGGVIEESEVDARVREVLRARLPAALEEPLPVDPGVVGCEEHVVLAREVAEQGIVLLDNDGVLPIADGVRVGVIGELAGRPATGDVGSSKVPARRVVTLLEGLQARGGARRLASPSEGAGVDVAVVVVGFDHRTEGEYIVMDPTSGAEAWQPPGVSGGGDRATLGLRPEHVALVEEVARHNPRTVVVLLGGSAITAPWCPRVAAVLHAFYPGQEGGHAVAALLHGDANPCGRLPFSVPEDEADLPPFDPAADTADYDLWHGYSRLERAGAALTWPFGHGLSYTTFETGEPELEHTELGPDDVLRVAVEVRNTGDRAGREVVQLYVGFPDFPVPRAPKLLKAFTKVLLDPGESRRVQLEVPVRELGWFDPERGDWRIEERRYEAWVQNRCQSFVIMISPSLNNYH